MNQVYEKMFNESHNVTKQNEDLKKRLKKTNFEKKEYRSLIEKIMKKIEGTERLHEKEKSQILKELETCKEECSKLQREIIYKKQNFCRLMAVSQKLKNLLTSLRILFLKAGIIGLTCLRNFNVFQNFVKASKVCYPTTRKGSST